MYATIETLAAPLVGHKIRSISVSDECLRFTTENGDVTYRVEGDCCSNSYFHDFVGVEKLLQAERVLSMNEVALDDAEPRTGEPYWEECVRCYGFQIVSEHPQWGEVTSAFSFRNSSNGYYGGWMELAEGAHEDLPAITADWVAD